MGALRRKSKRRKFRLTEELLNKERERHFEHIKELIKGWRDPLTKNLLPKPQQELLARLCRQEIRKIFVLAEPKIQASKFDLMPFIIGLPTEVENCFDKVLEDFTQYRAKILEKAQEEATAFVHEYFNYWYDSSLRRLTNLMQPDAREELLSLCLESVKLAVDIHLGNIPCGTHKHGKNLDLMTFSSVRTRVEHMLNESLTAYFDKHPIPYFRSIDDVYE
jgi:hypothetical protein